MRAKSTCIQIGQPLVGPLVRSITVLIYNNDVTLVPRCLASKQHRQSEFIGVTLMIYLELTSNQAEDMEMKQKTKRLHLQDVIAQVPCVARHDVEVPV
jgi:hypothetical protein